MNNLRKDNEALIGLLNGAKINFETTEVLVAPPALYLDFVRSKLNPSFHVAAQNCYKAEKGAFTGDIRLRFGELKLKIKMKSNSSFVMTLQSSYDS